jgi:class 3 adenylate cyclase
VEHAGEHVAVEARQFRPREVRRPARDEHGLVDDLLRRDDGAVLETRQLREPQRAVVRPRVDVGASAAIWGSAS